MKSTFLFFIFILLAPGDLLYGQQARFDEANDLLEEQQYRDALNIYKSIENEGYRSGALWLNMGITYSRIDSLGMAKFYVLRSAQYPETSEVAEEALIFINERFSRRSGVLPKLPWEQFFDYLQEHFGVQGVFLAGFFVLNGAVGLIIASWFFKRRETMLQRSGFSLLGLSLVILLSGLYLHYINDRYGTGVMVERQTGVYIEPDSQSAAVNTAYEGYQMRVDFHESEEADDWYSVRLRNGMYGWIQEDALMVF